MTDKEQVIMVMIAGAAVLLFLLIGHETMHHSYRECIKTDRVDCAQILNPNSIGTTSQQ